GELAEVEVEGAHAGDGAPEVAETSDANAEAAIAIPRPDEPGEPSVPTPPAAPSERKQQLFFGGVDEGLVEEARELLGRGRRLSASMLQRKLRIDYELAQELLRELGQRGLLGADEPA
ncbi:MAG: DNA translocase FtsK, partial [Planctomycetota bacterium]|nr:DNA translocase FtsK [Planctomycetota bacterium]